jgi:histidine triad (HIT) family protein
MDSVQNCLFCRIIDRKLPSKVILETERLFAFEDIAPQAPTHILVIPKKHIATLNDAVPDDAELLGDIVLAAAEIARNRNISGPGYRLVLNTNPGAGQSVFHVHVHLLGGRRMHWPPG